LPHCTNLRGVTHERMEGTLLDEGDVERVASELTRLRAMLVSCESRRLTNTLAPTRWPEGLNPSVGDVAFTAAFQSQYAASLRALLR